MKTKTHGHSRFVKIMMIPLRALSKARDLYVRGLNYADSVGRGYGNVGCPAGQFSAMPRSVSVSTSRSSGGADDLGELIRAASARSFGNKIDVDAILRQQQQQQQRQRHLKQRPSSDWGPKVLPKSSSVAMGRIDEEEPCEFGVDDDVKVDLPFPRSRSYAVGNRNHAQ